MIKSIGKIFCCGGEADQEDKDELGNQVENGKNNTQPSKIIETDQKNTPTHNHSENIFKIVQWNILAIWLGTKEGFPMVPDECLDPETRTKKIILALIDTNADIYTLEECDIFTQINEALIHQGYECHFVKKKDNEDGTMIAFKTNSFKFVLKEEHSLKNEDGSDGNRVFLHVQLEHIFSKKLLNVFATHLKAKKGNEKIREMEANEIKKEIQIVQEKKQAIIVAGDFNADPDEAAIQEILKLGLTKTIKEDKSITTWKYHWEGYLNQRQIDYIFYDENHLNCVYWWQWTDHKFETYHLPDLIMPSDHLPIWADLQFK